MDKEDKNYALVNLINELKLRKYSFRTIEKYEDITTRFLKSGKEPREFLLTYTSKSRSTIRSIYFALKFFYKNVLNKKFDAKIPLAKKSLKLPNVLNKEEVIRIIDTTKNLGHKLIIMFLYYAGLRLNELRNLEWNNIDFERKVIHLKISKGGERKNYFLAR